MNLFELCFLLLGATSLRINKLTIENDQVHIAVTSIQNQACCPFCSKPSASVHSNYLRHPQDLPWAAVPVVLHLTVKRFFCLNPACRKKTFAERFPDLVGWYQRRTKRVQEKQQRLSANTSARVAEFLLKDNQIGLSNTSINRLLRSLPEPPFAPVRVLGVDDWAKCQYQHVNVPGIFTHTAPVIFGNTAPLLRGNK